MNFINEVLWNIPHYLWSIDFMGRIVSVIWLLLILLIVVIIVGCLYLTIDESFLTYVPSKAKLLSKRIDLAHSEATTQTIYAGKTTIVIPRTINYPDRFYLTLEINKLQGVMQVEKDIYNKIVQGQMLTICYAKNRLSKSLSFKESKDFELRNNVI